MSEFPELVEQLTEEQKKALLMTHSWDGVVHMSPTLASLCDLGLLAVVVKTHTVSGWGASWTPLGLRIAKHLSSLSKQDKLGDE